MRVLVCGSRTWTNYEAIDTALVEALEACRVGDDKAEFVVLEGGARGADLMADQWATAHAKTHGVKHEVYLADWKNNGKAAGPIRNAQMLREGKPDLVLAFWDEKSRGTMDMLERAKRAGVPVRVIK